MWQKIKSALVIFLRGTFSGGRGFLGALMIAASLYFFVGLFTGIASVQNYFKNRRALGRADVKIETLQKNLDSVNLHIRLLQEFSPDFVSEMAIKYLNLGDPKMQVLKK